MLILSIFIGLQGFSVHNNFLLKLSFVQLSLIAEILNIHSYWHLSSGNFIIYSCILLLFKEQKEVNPLEST